MATSTIKRMVASDIGNGITGVKGNAESSYRTGNVNLTPANIGAFGPSTLDAITDANDNTLYGVRFFNGASCANLPDTTHSFELICMGNVQLAIQYNAANASELWKRYYVNSQWYAWAKTMGEVSGIVGVNQGGTGATTAAEARTNLGITPANIGAVSKAGDTMTGDLTVQKTWARTIYKKTSDNNTGVYVGLRSDRGCLQVVQYNDTTGKIEDYELPAPDATNDSYYSILTSKSPVTVAQGGTGATTAAAALTNLGAVAKGKFTPTLLYSGSPAVNETFSLSDYVYNYNAICIINTTHYSSEVYELIHNNKQTIMANGTTSFPDGTTPRFILWEFTATTSNGKDYAVARKAQMNITANGIQTATLSASFGISIYGLK